MVSGPRVDVEENTHATTRDIPLDRLDEFVGKEIGVSSWHVVDQHHVNLFAEATGDHMWFHVDIERSEREMGGTIAHGFMTLSLIPLLWHEVGRITGYKNGYNYGCDKVRFTAPVKTGARVRLRASMLPPEHRNGGIITPVKCVIEVEGEERPALVCDWREIFYV